MSDDLKKQTTSMSEFDSELASLNMRGQWQYDSLLERLIGGPKPAGVPYLWKWETVHEKLVEACDVMPESYTARRNFSFMNPGLERGGTTQTLIMGMQIVRPGEVAWAHRHTIGAVRFVVEGGDQLYTTVNGERLQMEPNDLILTPNWNWHDHHNETDKNAIWVDALDVPLVLALNQVFYEPFGETTQPQRQSNADYWSRRGSLVRPAWEQPPEQNFPFRYPWREVSAQLHEMAGSEGSPYDDIVLEYVNPFTGKSALPTMGCNIQMLRPGFIGKSHRQTSSAVYFVVEGEGTTVVGDEEINWSARDSFVVPNWIPHHHINRSKSCEAILFSINDIPVLQGLGLYHEDPENTVRARPLPPLIA